MGVIDNRVTRRDHVNRIPREGRDTVGRRRHRTDDSPRREVDDREAKVAAESHALKELNARHKVATDLEFLDLMLQPSDLGLVEFNRAPLLSLGHAHLADHLDRFASRGHPEIAELFKRAMRRFTRGSHVFIDTKAARGRRCDLWLGLGLQTGQHFAHHSGY